MARDELIEELKKCSPGEVKIEARFTNWCPTCHVEHDVYAELKIERIRTVPVALIEAIE